MEFSGLWISNYESQTYESFDDSYGENSLQIGER